MTEILKLGEVKRPHSTGHLCHTHIHFTYTPVQYPFNLSLLLLLQDVIIFCFAGPVWLKNLYAYLLVLRAIVKAEPYWKQYQFYTGSKVDDHITRIRVTKLTRAAQ